MPDQSRLPEALANLPPDQQLAAIDRMRTIIRARQGAEIVAAVQATLAQRSAASYAGEFFASRARRSTVADAGITQHRIEAEMMRLRSGTTALTNRPPPSAGAWTNPKLPRSGWTLLRIEDTGLPRGAQCELCEKAQMQHGYVVSHAAWPLDRAEGLGRELYACRLCAAHLLAEVQRPPKRQGRGRNADAHADAEPAKAQPLHERYPHKYRVPQAKPVDNRARRAVTLPDV
jgi:hypothetical protein